MNHKLNPTLLNNIAKTFIPAALSLLLFIPGFVAGQQITDVDSTFQEARELASEGNYSEARELANAILEVAPDYYGVQVFVARTYAWENRYREARSELNLVIAKSPGHADAHAALADVEFWSGNMQPAIRHITRAIHLQDDLADYYIRRAQIYIELQQYSLAGYNLRRAESLDSGNDQIARLEDALSNRLRRNIIAAGVRYDRYREDLPDRNQLYMEYHRITNRGPVIARFNYADRASRGNIQGEIEAYPTFSRNWYAYLNVGYSSGSLFPEFRAGAELYRSLPIAFETSVGFRHLKFTDDAVLIFTGSLSKYWKSWFFSFKPYFNTQESGLTTSYNFTARKYFSTPGTYVSLLGGFGFTADETRLAEGTADARLLTSRYTGIRGNKLFAEQFQVFGEVKVTNQELPFSDQFFLLYTIEAGIKYTF